MEPTSRPSCSESSARAGPLLGRADARLSVPVTSVIRIDTRQSLWSGLLLLTTTILVSVSAFSLYFDNPAVAFGSSWVVTVVAFVGAVLANATAVGGGVVFLPFFALFYAYPSEIALKLALSTQAFGMTSGAFSWDRRLIIKQHLVAACAASGTGMVLGTYLVTPSGAEVNLVFGVVSCVIGLALLVEIAFAGKRIGNTHSRTQKQRWLFALVCIVGGVITAWVSIGIGEIVALWMLCKWRYSISQSIATGVAALAFCSVLGFAFHIQLGEIPWNMLLFTAPGVILGGRVGAALGKRMADSTFLRSPGSLLKALVAVVIFVDGMVVLIFG